MTEAEVIDRINSTIKKNGNRTITGDEMNFILKAIIELIVESGGSKPLNSVLADGNETLEYDIILTELDRIVVGANRAGLSKGTFNTGRGGDKGVSLQCAVEFELNWQAGYLRVITPGGDGIPLLLQTDSEIVYTELVPTTPTYGRSLVDKDYADTKFPNPTGTTDQYIKGDGTLGTFPTIPSITGLVPYTGATANVNLGTFDLNAAKGTFTHSGSTDTLTATHSSGSGIGLLITKGGSNEGLKVIKTSGSGNAATIIGTLEATTLVKTGGTSTQFLMADGSTSLGGGITVGTTAVTSGTIGRVFFEGTGNVVQQSASLFWDNTNSRLGVGATPASTVRLDVRAQGALSTDIAFRVRNSVDSANLIEIAGNNTMTFLSSAGKIIFSQDTVGQGSVISLRRDFSNEEIIRLDGTNGGGITIKPLTTGTKSVAIGSVANGISMWTTGTNSHNFQIKNSFHNLFHVVGDPNVATATFRLGTIASNTNFFNIHGRNAGGTGLTTNPVFTVNSAGNFGNGAISFGTNAQFVFAQLNGVAPTTSPTDIYQQYSADITAGNAAPHFRTENGAIVKVYQETTAVVAAAFVANTSAIVDDTATFGGYTIGQVVAALKAQGLLA